MATQAKTKFNPLHDPQPFNPLGDPPTRRGDAPPAVEVLEASDGTVTIITRNQP